MAQIPLRDLLEAGTHFGHQTRRWNPKMQKFIFTERNGIHIIDLQKTVKTIDAAYQAVRRTAEEGKAVLFVGTKKQAVDIIQEQAERCGMFYVNQRWLGGMLTNWQTVQELKYNCFSTALAALRRTDHNYNTGIMLIQQTLFQSVTM